MKKDETPPIPTFSEWADQWYADYQTQVAESTYSGYRYTLNLLKKNFGSSLVTDVLPMEINSFFNRLYVEGSSHSKINKARTMLIQIYTYAVENKLTDRNPAVAAKVIRTELFENGTEIKKKDSFTEEEVTILFRELPKNFIGNSIRLLLITGMRIQELLALCAKDITSDGSIIHITKAVKMVDGKPKLGPPKSKKSRRDIPIPVDCRHLAVYLREHGGKLFLWQSHHISEPCTIEHFRHNYTKALQDIPVRKLTPHCCRHTYVTRLQARGVPMETIARLAGHSSISTTDVYLHTSIETLAQAVDTLGTGGNNHDA
jgi:integrase